MAARGACPLPDARCKPSKPFVNLDRRRQPMTMPLAQPQSDLSPSSNVRVASATPATIVEISSGLLARDAWTSPKYLYDALGSALFEAICALPEY